MEIFAKSDQGKQRKDNQDTNICQFLWDKSTYLLAAIDGVGGYAGGQIAAETAKESIILYLENHQNGERTQLIREALTEANNSIIVKANESPQFAKMSCVATVAIVETENNLVYFGHVGDTRLYLYKQGTLQKLSNDHSVIGYREEIGELTEEDAMQHPRRNEILRVLGMENHKSNDENFIDTKTEIFNPLEILLLCTDGLTDMITSHQISTILDTDQSLGTKVNQLIEAANDAGGKDNITAVLCSYKRRNNIDVKIRNTSEAGINKPIFPIIENKTEIITSIKPTENIAVKPLSNKKKTSVLKTILFTVFGILIGAGAMWAYFNRNLINNLLNPIAISTPDSSEDSLLNQIKNAKSNDTISFTKELNKPLILTLTKPIILKDSLFWIEKSTLTLISKDSTQTAIKIKEKANILLQNIIIKKFQTGIENNSRNLILKNVKMQNVKEIINHKVVKLPDFKNVFINISIDSTQKKE